MLKRIAIIALLGILGLVVGYTSTWLGGHRYYIGTTLWLSRDSPHSANADFRSGKSAPLF